MKNYNVNQIEKNILQIDGFGNNPIWNNAAVLTDFVSPWDSITPDKIELRALWDLDHIFFLYKVYDGDIHIDKTDDTVESIAKSDRVEIFFRKDDLLNPYYCLEIDPEPRILDFIAYPDRQFDYDWKWPEKHLTAKSNKQKDFFTVEIAISIESLKNFNLIKGNKIEAGLYRAKYIQQSNLDYEPVWISWINPNTETPNFHIASSFGTLTLM
ncbi:carbohydrate-binding family 9-like protein [Flavobacterium quisquiliarum]|uniref:Carbohydrate-binding family 9-like protein n=1 Tax=Flavobacterium quisquiliarum TaxID=1834436 RepID=A0ABV8W8Q1_9FLAO|nr:carbohydrate-binding family 9-like protein [Flavobacterium quisquiliarum]MBW1656416.1 endoxylanase [Flavobacterium quisquiliarum]NWL03916.1 endoxylanase [Flavobacterium collinsii]